MNNNDNSNMYKLTIAVLTYNRANLLKEMLDSILQQTYKDFYVIIYDNCSEDNTLEIVKPYLSDNRFKFHRHTVSVENGNYALKNCNTEYLLITHDDDVMLPDMVKREISILDSYNDISLVCSNRNHIDINSEIIESSFWSPLMNNKDCIINSKDYIKVLINKGNIITCPTVMFRMSVMKTNNLFFKEEIGGACDCYLWLEINQINYKFYYINSALYNYRIHDLQDSHNTLLLFPLLRKPVYNLLIKNEYSTKIIRLWLKRVEDVTIGEICKEQDKKKAFKTIKKYILFENKNDFIFILRIYYSIYFRKYIMKIKKIIKFILPYRIVIYRQQRLQRKLQEKLNEI